MKFATELEEYWKNVILSAIYIVFIFIEVVFNYSFDDFCKEIDIKNRKYIKYTSALIMYIGGMYTWIYLSQIGSSGLGLISLLTAAIISIFAGFVTSLLFMMIVPFLILGLILYALEYCIVF